jgi:nuclear transport factor 2 (NTF2) superfamily protein
MDMAGSSLERRRPDAVSCPHNERPSPGSTAVATDHRQPRTVGEYGAGVDVAAAARRWAGVWQSAWASKDVEAIVALYAPSTRYRALVLREPELGSAGVRAYLTRTFGEEDAIECRFGVPVVGDDRAAVEWWASWTEDGDDLTMAGVTLLRFDEHGLVVDHRDYWNQSDRREPPFDGW